MAISSTPFSEAAYKFKWLGFEHFGSFTSFVPSTWSSKSNEEMHMRKLLSSNTTDCAAFHSVPRGVGDHKVLVHTYQLKAHYLRYRLEGSNHWNMSNITWWGVLYICRPCHFKIITFYCWSALPITKKIFCRTLIVNIISLLRFA